ncbi:Casein kinase I isoform alpha [Tritrichomonas foetus]|uniref:non-specific serine/threonine protein kinase n=1 Tax=Tritrichomonas foetus TaxID=1144522 RepID=A0A1J4L373_9EUKA|nr:Casein kinase I isoform alpha [Tritrichomonas foetus]|eukprot:OHT16365.1 Casein kinase I isoform alpha [Tritrichomonas foetus]
MPFKKLTYRSIQKVSIHNLTEIPENNQQQQESDSSREEIPAGTRVDRYIVVELIGEGGYGDIYEVKDSETGNKYAMKIEYLDAEKRGLQLETKILKSIQSSNLFPSFIASGTSENFKYIVMELMGPSLSLLRREMPDGKLSKFSLLSFSAHMIRCIRKLHKFGYIHRDIKPGNFLIRPNRNSPLCLIDFGLSRRYIDKKTGLHKPPREDAGYTGTVRYASLHAHDETELSRRDDLISWFYSLLELNESKCPWPGSVNKELTIKMKREMTTEQLCQNLPKEFLQIINHIYALEYADEPDYDLILKLIDQAIKNEHFKEKKYDFEYLSDDEIHEISSISLKMEEPQEELYASKVDQSDTGYCCTIC